MNDSTGSASYSTLYQSGVGPSGSPFNAYFTVASAQQIVGSVVTFQPAATSAAPTVQLNSNLTLSLEQPFDVVAGTLNLNGHNMTGSPELAVGNEANIQAQGGETVTLFSNTMGGTATYVGGGSYAKLNLGNQYQNLVFNGAGGTWNTTGNVTAAGNVTITAGFLDSNAHSLTVDGNLTSTGTLADSSGTTKTITFGGFAQTFNNPGALGNLNLWTRWFHAHAGFKRLGREPHAHRVRRRNHLTGRRRHQRRSGHDHGERYVELQRRLRHGSDHFLQAKRVDRARLHDAEPRGHDQSVTVKMSSKYLKLLYILPILSN